MRAIVTGANGTVGKALTAELARRGIEVVPWNRSEVHIDIYQTMEDFIRRVDPAFVFHLAIASRSTGRENEDWLVNYDWPSELSWICRVLGIRFVFTSTAMVFSDFATGPFTVDSEPDAAQGYGYQKRRAETRIFHQNADALIARLGWQIGGIDGSNTMSSHLANEMRDKGVIRASTRWLPACSFLEDTANALADLALNANPGLYMIDSNRGWSYLDIVRALGKKLGRGDWFFEQDDSFVFDQRMVDPRVPICDLSARLDLPPLQR